MNKLWLYNWLKNSAKENGKIRIISKKVYSFLKISWVKTIFSAIFTILLSVECKLMDLKLAFTYEVVGVTIIIYIIYLVAVQNSDELIITQFKDREARLNTNLKNVEDLLDTHKKNSILFKEIINQQSKINSIVSNKLTDIYTKYSKSKRLKKEEKIHNSNSYQDIAFLVCYAIYDLIKVTTNKEKIQVTLFHKPLGKKDKPYIMMLAWGNKENKAPAAFKEKYPLYGELEYYHQKIFKANKNCMRILSNEKEVKENFKFNDKSIDREEKVQQYVGIPIFCRDRGIISLLQIDTEEKDLFGCSKDEIESFFAEISSFSNLILNNYYREEIQRMMVLRNIAITNRNLLDKQNIDGNNHEDSAYNIKERDKFVKNTATVFNNIIEKNDNREGQKQ